MRLREHEWTPIDRAVLISVLAVAMGALFLTTYSLAGDPVPRGIDAALIGDRAAVLATWAVALLTAKVVVTFLWLRTPRRSPRARSTSLQPGDAVRG